MIFGGGLSAAPIRPAWRVTTRAYDKWGRAIGCADTPCLARVTTRAYSPMRLRRIRLAFLG